jgi:molecular chaperone GrpE
MTDDIFQAAGQPAAEPAESAAPGQTAQLEARIAELENLVEATKQDVLYARAETQNVRRRLEKDIADARAYASTSFARDILSVADNLSRALDRSRPNCVRMRS